MLPNSKKLLNSGIAVKNSPSKTYHMNFKEDRTVGMTDGIAAIKQAIFLILHIERYDYGIYSWNYGVELKDLFGKPTTYACAVLPTRIREALLQDDRIQEVSHFETSCAGNTVSVRFQVESSHGTFLEEVTYSV